VLVRVPLGWIGATNMIKDANPFDNFEINSFPTKQSIELRSPDGSADIYKLFAGLVIAVEHGLEMKNALAIAEKLYVDYNIFKHSGKKLESLPASCFESADELDRQRLFYEKDNVFPAGVIDNIISRLKSFDDKDLSQKLYNRHDEIKKLVQEHLHCS
jgi:glutamine synthetase